MDSEAREYPYAPRWTLIVLGGGFFLLCAVVLGARAQGNDRGVIINGLIELSRPGATAFFWVLCACSMGFVAAAVLMAYQRLMFRRRLVLGTTTLIVPVSRWSREEQEIDYGDIQSLSTVEISGQRMLTVTHAGGKVTIMASMLPSKAVFEEVRALLSAKVGRLERLVRGA